MDQGPADRATARPSALVLAAGESRRFGGGKLIAPLAGRPLIGWVLSALHSARAAGDLARVVVVVRPGDSDLLAALEPEVERALTTGTGSPTLADSVRTGLAALAAPSGRWVPAALICLADQPGLRPETIAALIGAWRDGAGPALRPRYAERPDEPGHPLLLDRSAWALAESATGDAGLGPVLRTRPETIHLVDLPGANPDIDTPEDLARFRPPIP